MTLAEAARAVHGALEGADGEFTAVSTDSRSIAAGSLFIALRGERYDGHRFLADAAAAGACAAMVLPERLLAAADRAAWAHLPLITVTDTRLALGKLAAYWRARHAAPVAALTGSSGKTTVKEMLAAILRAACGNVEDAVLATRGNLNNDIGVPLTLLRLTPAHRYAVVEMGMNHAGEIRYLTQLAAPNVVLVNNAGTAHIEYLGSEEAIAQAKGEIYDNAPASAVAVINADDRYAPMWRESAGARRRVEFGLQQGDVQALYRLGELTTDVDLQLPAGRVQLTLPAPGVHNVRNALGAAAVAVALGISPAVIGEGLAAYAGIEGRLQQRRTPEGATLIDDTYNANPDSVRAAIDVLAATTGKRLLILGDMGELGVHGPALHEEIGRYAQGAGIDELYCAGALTAGTVRAFGEGARHFDDVAALIDAVRPELNANVAVLVKGSRFMRMERVVAALLGLQADGGGAHA